MSASSAATGSSLVAVFAFLLSIATPAGGQEVVVASAPVLRLPIPQSERPLTLPSLILDPYLEVEIDQRNGASAYAGTYPNLTLGLGFGVTDDLTVEAVVVPLQLGGPPGTGVHYGETTETRGPSVGARYRFLRGVVELGAELDVRVLTSQGVSGVNIIPSIPLRVHATRWLRLDLDPELEIFRATSTNPASLLSMMQGTTGTGSVGPTSANAVRLDVPLSVLVNVVRPFDLALDTGFRIFDLSEAASSTGIPLGLTLGLTVPGRQGPLLDIDPFFSFPYLLMPGATTPTDTRQWVTGVTLNGYLYL